VQVRHPVDSRRPAVADAGPDDDVDDEGRAAGVLHSPQPANAVSALAYEPPGYTEVLDGSMLAFKLLVFC
jgi:hypothetical protein